MCRIGGFTLAHFAVAMAVMAGYFSFVGYMHNSARLAEVSGVEEPLLRTAGGAGAE